MPAGFQPSAAQEDHLAGTSRAYSAPVLTANAAFSGGVDTAGHTIGAGYAYTPPSTTFNADQLGSGGSVKVPTSPLATNPATPIIAGAQASEEQAQKQAEQDVKDQNAGVDKLASDRTGIMDKVYDLVGLQKNAQTARISDETAIDPFRQDLANINKQIADYNVQYRGETDAINGRGDLSDNGRQSLQTNTDSKYGRILADLAIRQSAANTNIEDLEKAADRKLALTLAPIQSDIDYYKNFALENNDALTKNEKDKVSQIISEKQNILDNQKDQQSIGTTALKTALENGIKLPDNVVKQILDNPSQAYAIMAANNISLENPLDAAKKQADLNKVLADLGTGSQAGIIKAANGKALTADQSKVYGFANRVSDANSIINDIGGQFASVGSLIGQFAPNALQSPERQQFEQAKKNFVNAVLRRESGAAISAGEFTSADKQYFPQPGDSQAVLDQKADNRQQVYQNLLLEAGNPIVDGSSVTKENTNTQMSPVDNAYLDEIEKKFNLK